MPTLHGFDERGARRIVQAVRDSESRVRNDPWRDYVPGVPYPGFWARLQAIDAPDGGELASYYDAATESYSWLRQLQQPDGTWIDHPLVNIPDRELCGFHRGFAPDLAAAFEVNDVAMAEDSIVWMRPGSQDKIAGAEKATRCYLFETGGDDWWYAELTSRCERAYTWTEIAPQSIAWPIPVWAQCSDPQIFDTARDMRSGVLNAFDINGAAHNSQGGTQAVVVRMWQGGMVPRPAIPSGATCIPTLPTGDDAPKAFPYFLFDFNTTNECDGERLVFP